MAPRENKTMEVINKNDIIISKKYEFLFTVAKIISLANHLRSRQIILARRRSVICGCRSDRLATGKDFRRKV